MTREQRIEAAKTIIADAIPGALLGAVLGIGVTTIIVLVPFWIGVIFGGGQ